MENYTLLISKLDNFIRKYYLNQLLRGALYTASLILILFLAFNLLEHEFYFSSLGRKFLFFFFVFVSFGAITLWIAIPLFHYFQLGKTISHERAAQIIGEHFTDVKDKLLNVLQLRKQSLQSSEKELIEASIAQKSSEIKLVPFQHAIDLGKNKKYIRYAAPPLLLLLLILFAAPSIITDSTMRIINNGKEFVKAAPFQFVFTQKELSVIQYEDFNLHVTIEGEKYPNDVFIQVGDYQYRLNKIDNHLFSYAFKNVQRSQDFKIYSGEVTSEQKTLAVLPKPNLVDFNIDLVYPSYLKRSNEKISNIGDLTIPQGTRVNWQLRTQNTDLVQVAYSSRPAEKIDVSRKSKESYTHSKTILKDEVYTLFVSNKFVPKGDSVSYSLNVIPDQYPNISVQSFQDSLDSKVFYFIGNASDDYGLSLLSFHYTHSDENGVEKDNKQIQLSKPVEKDIQYDYFFDLNELSLLPGDRVNYYFEVFDNDGVNGRKSAKTNLMSFVKPTISEFEDIENSNEEDIKNNLEKSLEDLKNLKEEIRKMREKLLQEKELDWQNKKELEKLFEKQQELQKMIEEAQEKFEENLKNQKEFSEQSEETKEKQEQLQKLFEELMDEESEDLMEKIQELLKELDKENSIQMLEDFSMNEETMEKNMDRLLELFKQLELEKELNEAAEKLNKLAEKQEQLSEETKSEESSKEELIKEQEEINEDFKEIKEDIEDLEKKNEELEFPKSLGDENEERMEDIQDELNESQEELQKSQNQKASEKQKKAAQKMKSMAGNLQNQMKEGEMKQMQEDLKTLRQLLENLVTLSFDQEELVGSISRTNINTPRYVTLVQDQYRIKDDFKIVEDSLQELSKRVAQIESFITDKVSEVNYNLKESLEKLEERQKPTASQNQRFTMKNLNDLALMLSESMNNMQQQMAAMMQGDQMCDNPGQGQGQGQKGQVPMDKITEGQENLQEGMKEMMEGMEKGKGGSAKEFAEAAARQAALRKALEEMQKMNEEQGKGASGELQEIIDQMDKNEIDLVNKRLNHEMIQRQQDIITRLLDAEKAEREREFDNKRKSQTGKDIERKMPPSIEEFIKNKGAEVDMYRSVSPSLRPYYKQLVEEYFKALKSQKSN